MPVRRSSDPFWVQHIWDGIRFINHQRQQTDLPRLTKYLQKVVEIPDISEAEIEEHIRKTQQDNLLISENRTGFKGQKVGVVVECFRIPTADNSTPEDDGHDYYCIECHLPGDVNLCTNCHRVFHLQCHKDKIGNKVKSSSSRRNSAVVENGSTEENKSSETSVENSTKDVKEAKEDDVSSSAEDNLMNICSVCQLQNQDNHNIDKDDLNYILSFTLNRIKIWLPANLTDTMAPRNPQPWTTEQEYQWRANQLLYQTMDFRIIDMKLRTKEYTKLAEFQADVLTMQHNVAIFHGLDSQEMESSKLMLQDCVYDLLEIAQCLDCYRHSNEKSHSNWFCIPCKKPHQLVWAKQKGYPYWPAKVIKETNGQYDVRFFGAKHLRSVIDKNFIKPIETSIQSLSIKRTSAFNKALQELYVHQELLRNPEEVDRLLNNAENKKKSKERRLSLSPSKPTKTKKSKLSQTLDDIYEFQSDSMELPSSSKMKFTSSPKASKSRSTRNSKRNSTSSNPGDIKIDDQSDKECDIIDISDNEVSSPVDSSQDFVSSSTGNSVKEPTLTCEKSPRASRRRRDSNATTQSLDRPYSDSVEKLRRVLETIADRDELIKVALDTMQQELDNSQSIQAEHVRTLMDSHNQHVSEIKKKQWCYNCEQEAIYHCCWNTAYCSTTCQQQHWQSEHKKVCRRKR